MDSGRSRRAPLKAHAPCDWKTKLRQNCLRRAQEDRTHLIWKIRNSAQAASQKEIVKTAVKDIVSDELKKLNGCSLSDEKDSQVCSIDDILWEYNGVPSASCSDGSDHEELLIEMERLLYEDLRKELIRRELDAYEEQEEYLSQAVLEQMQLRDDQTGENGQVWCPVCKQGELREDLHVVFCTRCQLKLDLESDKMNLSILRHRLGEVYEEHLDRGCKVSPKFCTEGRFDITALYIKCEACDTFEIVL